MKDDGKDDGPPERNHLAGRDGDAINALPCATGHDMRLLARWLGLCWLWALTRALVRPTLVGMPRQGTVVG